MAELDSVPGFERPMGAGTRDILLSEDELGNKTYRNPTTGVTYTIRPNRDQRTALRKAKDWWNAGAELPTAGEVVEAVAGLPAAVYDTAQRTLRNEATLGEAMSFAPAMGAASLPFEAPEGAVRIFGGLRAQTAPVDRLPIQDWARESVAGPERLDRRSILTEEALSTLDPRVQWEESGWYVGPDDMARYEIPDDNVKVITKAEIDQLAKEVGVTPDEIVQMTRDSNFLALSDIMDHPSLFEAYPELANLPVRFDPELSSGEGIFDFSRIHLSPEDLNNPDVLKRVALHEAQHWVQNYEGFYNGSNLSAMRDSAVGRQLSEEYWKRKDQIDADKSLSPEERASRTEEALRKFNDDLFDAYERVYGEDEARAVESRLNLTPLERSEMFPEDSGILSRSYGRNVSRRTLNPYSGEEIPRRRYAEGGAVPMEDQMKFAFMADGGMIDDGKKVEPTTGNKVPPGSLANEVKDHVNAKLSPGEYVLPADVVQYYGLDKIEKLVGKAKEGLADLESRGRIGGKQDSEEDDLPFSDEELKSMDSEDEDEDELEFAEGGAVPQASGMHNRVYVDSQGTEHNVLFMGNMPLGFIDPTWRLKTQQVQEEVKAPETTVEAVDTGTAGDTGEKNAEGPKGPDQWSLEDFQKFDPSGSPLGPIGNVLGGLGAGGGLISWGIEAMRQGTVNRAYEEIQNRLQNPDLDEQTKADYTAQLERYRQARENPQRNTGRTSGGLLGNLFGGDGLLGSMFGGNRQQTTTPTNTPRTPSPVAAPAGLGGGDDNNYAPSSSPRPQARSVAQASPGARGVGGETQKVTTTTGKRTETKNKSTNPGGFDKGSGSWSVGPMAEGGLVARPKRRNKPKK